MFQEAKMLKTKTSLSGTNMAESTSNGMLSTLTNGRVNQRRENSTKTSVFMLRDHSTLFLKWEEADTSTLLEETWSSRQEMEEELNNGTSINNPIPLNPDPITNLGIFKAKEDPLTCKFGAPTQDGGKSSNTVEETSTT
jgi:hypothetical protein